MTSRPWTDLSEEEWQEERKRIREIQDKHINRGDAVGTNADWLQCKHPTRVEEKHD